MRKGQRKRLQLRASRCLGQGRFYGFCVSFSFFFFLVCVIMCKVEEKQLEAALSGDGGGRGRNKNTSGLFKLLLASPCTGSSTGPQGRLRFLFLVSSGGRSSEQNSAEGAGEETGFVCIASQKEEMGVLLSSVDTFNLFPIQKIFCIC